jgi:hypothetical protein
VWLLSWPSLLPNWGMRAVSVMVVWDLQEEEKRKAREADAKARAAEQVVRIREADLKTRQVCMAVPLVSWNLALHFHSIKRAP